MGQKPTRKILHLDLDAFFCAVEELNDPSLRGTTFAVGGKADRRGVIASCSYPARHKGVRSAMPTGQALRLCPELILISSHFGEYSKKSSEVMEILRGFSALVEQISVDEAFIDVTDLPQPMEEIAAVLQAQVKQKTSLPCSIGGATNKLVAKIATDTGKSRSQSFGYPEAILVVTPGGEKDFLAPLPVKAMWGVGPKMEASLAEIGIKTIGDLAGAPPGLLERRFGKNGEELSRHASGIDERPVTTVTEVKSISQEVTFTRDSADLAFLRRTLQELAAKVGYRMRCEGVCARVIRIKLRWSDFTTLTRQVALSAPTDVDGVIAAEAEMLLMKAWQPGRTVRLLGVGGSSLVVRAQQLELWQTNTEKERKLLTVIDELNEKYGNGAVKRAGHLQQRDGGKKAGQ